MFCLPEMIVWRETSNKCTSFWLNIYRRKFEWNRLTVNCISFIFDSRLPTRVSTGGDVDGRAISPCWPLWFLLWNASRRWRNADILKKKNSVNGRRTLWRFIWIRRRFATCCRWCKAELTVGWIAVTRLIFIFPHRQRICIIFNFFFLGLKPQLGPYGRVARIPQWNVQLLFKKFLNLHANHVVGWISFCKVFKGSLLMIHAPRQVFIHIYATGDLLGNECWRRNGVFRQITKTGGDGRGRERESCGECKYRLADRSHRWNPAQWIGSWGAMNEKLSQPESIPGPASEPFSRWMCVIKAATRS